MENITLCACLLRVTNIYSHCWFWIVRFQQESPAYSSLLQIGGIWVSNICICATVGSIPQEAPSLL